MHSVKFLRLMNGDDIISEVVEVGDENQIDYMLINPLKVVYIPSSAGAGYLQVAFMPWVFSSICDTQDFLIHAEDVLTMNEVSEKMGSYYWKNLETLEENKAETEKFSEEVEDLSDEDEGYLEEILQALKESKRTLH